MKRSSKIWLLSAAALLLVGALIFAGVMTALKWNFGGLMLDKYENEEYTLEGALADISVTADTAVIQIVPATDGKVTVKTHEHKRAKHTVTLKDGKLTVAQSDQRKWYEHIFDFGKPTVTVALPAGAYGALTVDSRTGDILVSGELSFASAEIKLTTGDVEYYASTSGEVNIQTNTGDIEVKGARVGALSLSVTTGDVELSSLDLTGALSVKVSTGDTDMESVTAKSLASTGSTGDMSLQGVTVAERMEIERSTGDVRFEGCDAGEILVRTDTGSVTGSLLSEKVFIARTDTGRVDVPRTVTGGRCEITTDTGDIILSIGQKDD